MPDFSVIVPVYNVAAYLPACVESVLAQTHRDYELILVDDGSTDESPALCDGYAAADGRVQVIHQANRGLAGARNAGLALATGAYILFLDSDDFWTGPQFLEKLWTLAAPRAGAQGPDVILYNYARAVQAGQGPPQLGRPRLTLPWVLAAGGDAALDDLMEANAWQSSAAIKAVRRLAIGALRFEEGVLSEDIEYSARLLLTIQGVAVLDEVAYAYRVRAGSISETVSPRHVADLTAIVQRLCLMPGERGFPQQRKRALLGYAAFQYCTLLINMRICAPPVPVALRQEIYALAPVLRHARCREAKLVRDASRLLGVRLTSRLLAWWFRRGAKNSISAP